MAYSTKKERLLVVDDSVNTLEVLKRNLTSPFGLSQFSLDKENTVRCLISRSMQALITSLKDSTPALCPAERGRFLLVAHLPLPSIITAT